MRVSIGCRLRYSFPQPTPLIAMLNVHYNCSEMVLCPLLESRSCLQRKDGLDFAGFYPFECPQTGKPLHRRKSTAAGADVFCVSKSGISKRRLCPCGFNRSSQHTGQISLLVFRIARFFVAAR